MENPSFVKRVIISLSTNLPQWTSGHSAAVVVIDEENVEAVDGYGLQQGKRVFVFPQTALQLEL